MMGKQKRELREAQVVARSLYDKLEIFCERLAVCGSIRRMKPLVGDCELVLIPDEGFEVGLSNLVRGGIIEKGEKWGEKYKQVVFGGMQFDLFYATEHNWGVIQWLRTGSAEANMAMVTHRKDRAYAPFYLKDGYIVRASDDVRLSVRDEHDVYELWGMDWIEPRLREGHVVRRALGQWVRFADVSDWAVVPDDRPQQLSLF